MRLLCLASTSSDFGSASASRPNSTNANPGTSKPDIMEPGWKLTDSIDWQRSPLAKQFTNNGRSTAKNGISKSELTHTDQELIDDIGTELHLSVLRKNGLEKAGDQGRDPKEGVAKRGMSKYYILNPS